MNKKREELLNEMIAIYIRDGEPIGSESLRITMGTKISSATIRNYFKVLVKEGILAQPHISSGRIPTNNTLKSYWRSNIDITNVLEVRNLEVIKEASEEYNIFCNVKIFKQDTLKELINYKNKYSLLIFDNSEVIVPYNAHLHQFLSELINKDIEDIKTIAKSVCVNSLCEKLENEANAKIYNFGFRALCFIEDPDFVLEIIKGNLCYRLKNGFYFDLFGDGYIGILQDIKFGKDYGKMFVTSELKCDYSAFYNAIAS